MYNSLQLGKRFLRYYFTALNSKGHGMHSPFVFDFILRVLNNKAGYQPPKAIEMQRQLLLSDQTVLPVIDLGAGSRRPSSQKTVSRLARTALKPKKYGQLLFRLASHYQPGTIIELGTSLGITTCYLAAGSPGAVVHTIEGNPSISSHAANVFSACGSTNIQQHTGNFDDLLPAILQNLSAVDLAYVDGNHLYAPTMAYFNQLLLKSNENTILVFDDIHWSAEMEQAWKEIQDHPAVRTTVDIFFLGFVFFRTGFREKQRFSVRF
jgi:predicted O-methyltransferase YrrM